MKELRRRPAFKNAATCVALCLSSSACASDVLSHRVSIDSKCEVTIQQFRLAEPR